MRKMGKKTFIVFVVFYLITVFYNATAYAQSSTELLEQVKYLVNKYYVKQVGDDVLSAKSIDELLKRLGDPYSSYLTQEQYRQLLQDIEMEFIGIGVTVTKVSEGLLITSVFKGSGAELAGLQPGDIILSVNGINLKDMTLTEAVTYIRGPEGTAVLLQIKRGENVFLVGVLRKRFTALTVEYNVVNSIGYVRVWSFGTQTDIEFYEAISQMEKKGIRGLVIDLRGNGGGYLHTALNMAAGFIGNKPAVIAWNKNDGFIPLTGVSSRTIVMPVIILTDNYTASASEVFSAALRDYGIAAIIGGTTFGKGSIQSLFELSNGDMLKLTTHYFYTSKGKTINGVGLEPDLNLQDEHLLNVAVLLLSGDAEEKKSKKGFVGVKLGDKIYDINLDMARMDEYWESFMALVKSLIDKGMSIYVGTEGGWVAGKSKELYKWYFPDYDEVPTLRGVASDKDYTVTFSRPVDDASAKDKIELIDAETGERVPCLIHLESSTSLKVKPQLPLKKGKEYYLVIKEGVKSTTGLILKNGVLCRIIVSE